MDFICNKNSTEFSSTPDRDDFLLGIFLVKSGSKGDSLLFRYPYTFDDGSGSHQSSKREKKSNNPFALIVEDVKNNDHSSGPVEDNCRSGHPSRVNKPTATYCIELDPVATTAAGTSSDINLETVIKLPDRVVSTLFAVKNELCGKKIEIKINDVRFVGHPLLISSAKSTFPVSTAVTTNQQTSGEIGKSNSNQGSSVQANTSLPSAVTSNTSLSSSGSSLSSSSSYSSSSGLQNIGQGPKSKDIVAFNVVFALRANASHEVVNSFHKCSQQIAVTLNKEEYEKGYLSKEAKAMLTCHDEASSPSDEGETSPYSLILQRSQLAADLKKIFEDLKSYGTVQLKLNKSSDLSLCIPQTVHRLTLKYHRSVPLIGPRELNQCFSSLRPYHALLLLTDPKSILDSITENRQIFQKILFTASPFKSLSQLARDTREFSIGDVCKAACQLVYWAKATLIYPLTESNVYIINPLAPTSVDCPLVEKYRQTFNGSNLLKFLAEFSLGTSIDQLRNPLHNSQQQIQLCNQIVWLLKHRLISQLHTYVYLLPLNSSPCLTKKSKSSKETPNKDDVGGDDKLNGKEVSFDGQVRQQRRHSSNPFNSIDLSKSSISDDDDYLHNDATSLSMNYERAMHLLRELGLRDYECESICQVPAAKNYEDLCLFAKLCHYFDGKNHLEHIMHYEKVKRTQLLVIIDKFREILFTCQHEDKTIFQLCPYLYE